jgi:methanogenic corrinoid protein MtbC1
MPDFAPRLRRLRTERGLRQKDLARLLGVAQTTIANYEQGTRFPDEEMLNRIADLFGASFDFLLGRDTAGAAELTPLAWPTASPWPDDPLAGSYLRLLLDGREEQAAETVLAAVRQGRAAPRIYEDLLRPVLIRVGDLWERGQLDVGMEHYITAAVERLMGRIRPLLPRRAENGLSVVGMSVGAETHAVGIRMVLDLLEADGWRSYYLGHNVPGASVTAALQDRSAALLALSATVPAHLQSMESLLSTVRARSELSDLRVLAGGRAFLLEPDALTRFSSAAYAPSADEAVAVVRELFGL